MSGSPSEDGKRMALPQGVVDPTHVPDFGSFLRQVFPETRMLDGGMLGSLARPGVTAGALRRDYETAFNLLQRASDSFPVLLRHCQQLEAEVRRVRAEADAEARSAHGDIQQWQQVAVALKMRLDESEHQAGLLRKRLAAAEERLAAGHSITQQAEQQANLALGITTLFHDKIVDAFGVGSPAHAALDSIAQGMLGDEEPEKGGR